MHAKYLPLNVKKSFLLANKKIKAYHSDNAIQSQSLNLLN